MCILCTSRSSIGQYVDRCVGRPIDGHLTDISKIPRIPRLNQNEPPMYFVLEPNLNLLILSISDNSKGDVCTFRTPWLMLFVWPYCMTKILLTHYSIKWPWKSFAYMWLHVLRARATHPPQPGFGCCLFSSIAFQQTSLYPIYWVCFNWQPGVYNYFRLFHVVSYPYFSIIIMYIIVI